MISVIIVYFSKLHNKYMYDTKEFTDKVKALRGIFAMRSKGIIIDGWRCDDPLDNEYLSRRVKL